ncbi:MAG: polysaccharide biosynthesis protein, partial [Azoarcus sp.]|nr:polysaccharide biosynthesis protein [Azoarcus sp.]
MTTRLLFVILFDSLAVFLAWAGGLLLRFNFVWPSGYSPRMLWIPVALLFIQVAACQWARVYRSIWRFASVPDLKRVLRAVAVSTIGIVAIKALTPDTGIALPRAMLVLYPVLLTAVMCGGRLIWRMWKDHHLAGRLTATSEPVIIVGAGRGGAMLIPALTQSADWRVVALVDDDRAKWGLELSGFPIEGGIDDLPQVLARHGAKHVILAMPSASLAVIKRATNIAVGAEAQTFIVPGVEELMCGRVEIDSMRPVAVDDLLGREPVYIDTVHVQKLFAGRTVLVTGAGGSIGSELCRQIARFEPKTLVLLEA